MSKKENNGINRKLEQDSSVEALKNSFNFHLKYSQAKDEFSATTLDKYNSIALAVRDRLVEKWIHTQQTYYENDSKRIYYLSMEFLVGRALKHYLVNLDFQKECYQAIEEMGYDLEEIQEQDIEAGLGNGGLGRLAACYLESMSTLSLPAYGYGIRYEYGIFYQKIIEGYQVETADNWLRNGFPWEIQRPENIYQVKFYGKSVAAKNGAGEDTREWVDTHDDVMALGYDIPIPGYHTETVNNLRLWAARSTREFDLSQFNTGDYLQSVSHKQETEIISKVLYPNDNTQKGKELRLKQEYFFVSASLQDIIRRYKKTHTTFEKFSDKVAIQLNDTHPALAIPELMRILLDKECRPWEEAWGITVKTFAYTNHTILPEALEKWSVDLLGTVLPRHLEIIYEINKRFLADIKKKFPKDPEKLSRMSLIEENHGKSVRMAHLAIVGSHATNGVAEMHTNLLKTQVFKDFYNMFPERFQNKTNGITQRHWLKACNPELTALVTKTIGNKWITHLDELKKLLPKQEDKDFHKLWQEAKKVNKIHLAEYIKDQLGIIVDPDSIFDVQVKRIHEYKRQLLCLLHVIALYNRIKEHPNEDIPHRTVIFAGKAAPGYTMAKLIIKLITSVGEKINHDKYVGDRLKVVFLPNYRVSLASKIIPAADLSEQISTAGTEASGTGNMKLALNGALTIGTWDGANIEILEETGEENMFMFGLTADEVKELKESGYDPKQYYSRNPELKTALDMIKDGYFSQKHKGIFDPIISSLLEQGDHFMVLADFEAYMNTQKKVEELFKNPFEWTQKSIINCANIGKFSSDRSVMEYAKDIWKVKPQSWTPA